jgi:hypothetical protein
MTVLDEKECGMALITTTAKTVLILLIRVPYIFYYSAELRTVNNVGHVLWVKYVSPSLIIQTRHVDS